MDRNLRKPLNTAPVIPPDRPDSRQLGRKAPTFFERHRRAFVLGLIALVLIAGLLVLARHFELRALMAKMVESVRAAGPVPFFSAMAILPGLGFPLSAFLAVAGPVFGPTLGVGVVVLCAVSAVVVNVALFYWVAARGLRPVALWFVHRLGYRLPDIPPRAVWSAILLLRIVPGTPFFLQTLILGLARVPFGAYMLVSALVPSAYITAIIVLGDGLMRRDWWAIAIAGALFFVAGGIIDQTRRYLQRRDSRRVDSTVSKD